MVYTKVLFNNIKEYTPSFIKTIPYRQTVKPTFVKQAQVVTRFNADPRMKRFWRFFRSNVQLYPWVWQLFILGISYGFYASCYYPWLTVYQAKNQERTIDAAIAREKAWAKKQEEAEEEE
ncbi:hypothetical protein PPERSA_01904 [Pseudocohnilembus persalinus]|uniref:Uncharacterized protein n=1 Tax=Pseudocohnilembus persalinus TaxID=266149 RepID=A0A0V0R3E0_PSEPJ|nr:hypothetical protein PPERSA_01904 [Pseudocohnilembus persalinus]|eukprot:KRX09017.1 hypothetical protein PPERSA_01904 [Pseudocohnilembus persalinus]